MGGRGGSSGRSGGGSGGGWGNQPELTGSDRQVSWANDIRQRAMDTIDFNLRSSREHYNRTNITSSMIRRDLYGDMKNELSGILQRTSKASEIINMRDRLNPQRITRTVNNMAEDMATQISNGWSYDKKRHRTVRPQK